MPKNQLEYELKDHQHFVFHRKLWKVLKSENEILKSKFKLPRKISLVCTFGLSSVFQGLILKTRIKDNELKNGNQIFVIGHSRSGAKFPHYMITEVKALGFII